MRGRSRPRALSETRMAEQQINKQPVAQAEAPERERAVLVAVVRDGQDPRQAAEYLDELEFLAETADIACVRRFTQRLAQPSARIYVGPGKLEEIAAWCGDNAIDVVIFDDELSPSQTRNIERAMPCRILDRTRLILDIFMRRAQTAYAKTQVQLANYEYTWNGSAAGRVRAAVRANARSRPTAASCAAASPNSRRSCRRSTAKWPFSARTADRWCGSRWSDTPTSANRR